MHAFIDHLTVTAPSLAQGAAFVEKALGIELQAGGEHPRMGTHNRLLRLGDDCYLEVIAIDPEAASPGWPRWFGLDALTPHAAPRLATWVARVADIRAASSALQALTGTAQPMTRGSLRWQITVRPDGALAEGGAAPALIEWPTGTHPAPTLREAGCRLVGLQLFHPNPANLLERLAPLELESRITIEPLPPGAAPALVAHLDTPAGRRTLGTPPVS